VAGLSALGDHARVTAFAGFPPEALDFLRELEAHNDRDWFREHKGRFQEHLTAPMAALAADLEPDFGQPRTFRPYNDTRFHARPPIKEQVGLALGMTGGAGGFYVELSLDGLFVAGGLYQPSRDQLARMREAIDDPRRGGQLEAALATAQKAGLEPFREGLKRAPKGFSPDHPRIALLRMTSMTAGVRHPLRAWLHTRECARRIRAGLEAVAPLVAWTREQVGPPQAAPVP
jgi:uncharacterized protein (TIGR02453 family)